MNSTERMGDVERSYVQRKRTLVSERHSSDDLEGLAAASCRAAVSFGDS